jgi:putative transposase
MSRKTYRPEAIIAKLRQAEILPAQGKKVPEVVKAIDISEVSYYRWRKEYGGLNVSQAKRLKGVAATINEELSRRYRDSLTRKGSAWRSSRRLAVTALSRADRQAYRSEGRRRASGPRWRLSSATRRSPSR